MTAYLTKDDLRAERRLYGANPWLLQPGYWAIRVYRFGQTTIGRRGVRSKARHGLYFLLYSVIRLATGIDIPRTVRVGQRVMIHHFGGIIIHPQVVIGNDCVLRHGVTIGERKPGAGVPIIGDRVEFGAYAQVLGAIEVGDGARLGSLSVVLEDVPPGASAVGVPARIVGGNNA